MTPDKCIVIGGGYQATYTSGHWSNPTPLLDGEGPVGSLSCASASFCAAPWQGGADGQPRAVAIWQNSTWRLLPMPGDGHTGLLKQIACASPTLCAVDADQDLRGYDGHEWFTRILPPGDSVAALACGPGFCLGSTKNVNTGYDQTLITRDGRSWSPATPMPEPIATNQIIRECPAAGTCVDIYNVSPSGTSITIFRDGRWSKPKPLPGLRAGQPTLVSAACPDPSHCLVLGDHGRLFKIQI